MKNEMEMKFVFGFLDWLFRNWNQEPINSCWNPFFGFEFYCKILKTVFQNLNTEFPIERNPTTAGSGTQVRKALV